MGTQKEFIATGGFSTHMYRDYPGFNVVEFNDVRAKAIYHIDDSDKKHFGLPMYAETSDMYVRVINGEARQARLYADRKMVLDFDWDHSHTNGKKGEFFPKGTVHVQEYYVDKNGKTKRHSDKARLMTDAEIKKYGPIIHAFNPKVKFR